jgi:hypothetical protein
VVFVGTAFGQREALLSAVDWTGIDLGLYGIWGDLPPHHELRPFVHDGLVDNAQAGALYRAARVGLNLYRDPAGRPAQSMNPRAYELAADGVYTIAQPRPEQGERFGHGVATFTTPRQLEEAVREALADPWRRQETAARLPGIVRDDTYHTRAAQLVAHLA